MRAAIASIRSRQRSPRLVLLLEPAGPSSAQRRIALIAGVSANRARRHTDAARVILPAMSTLWAHGRPSLIGLYTYMRAVVNLARSSVRALRGDGQSTTDYRAYFRTPAVSRLPNVKHPFVSFLRLLWYPASGLSCSGTGQTWRRK
jgi:hypothetical protein